MIELADLPGLVICPTCRGALQTFLYCANCGSQFTEVNGTPALFPKTGSRKVAFQFTHARSSVTDGFRNSFQYPANCGSAGSDTPYHLHLAHLEIIDQLGAKILGPLSISDNVLIGANVVLMCDVPDKCCRNTKIIKGCSRT
jgi:hypothetical protein